MSSFEEAIHLLENRINLEQLQTFAAEDMTGRLDTLRQLLSLFGSPETKYRTVHVAGTKGKGSVCAFLESMFLAEGKRVGTFTSPHLYSVTERIRINGEACSNEDFAQLVFSVCGKIEPAVLETLTYFELITLLGFVYFAEQKIDVAVIEVGLGGRLDATSICRPDTVVISSISYDHIMQLGPALASIAAEKCGIIKPRIPVVSAVLHPEVQNVVRSKAKEANAPVYFLDESFFVKSSLAPQSSRFAFRFQAMLPEFPLDYEIDGIELSMPGSHQIRNAALAIAARLLLHQHFAMPDVQCVREGLQRAILPLRVEIVHPSAPDKPVIILDGAHNRSSVRAFIKTVTERFPNRRMFLVFGVSMGKDVEGMISELSGFFYHIFLTQYSNSSRAFPAAGLKRIFALDPGKVPQDDANDSGTNYMEPSVSLNPAIFDAVRMSAANFDEEPANLESFSSCVEALQHCLRIATPNDIVCVTGSMYLAAELRKYIINQ
ncbi:MAG: bifunctional folylpolyglutamate synthase/dihydrofolate synthase [Planctomycetaceae bacterium]|jgi:dihydrofolate synthase/folylpolyglutamate synthase|nr:bifunctional folylpolyglutamate synthase/dihydrofolate synthase [Planctomycetaceae bacterium]